MLIKGGFTHNYPQSYLEDVIMSINIIETKLLSIRFQKIKVKLWVKVGE